MRHRSSLKACLAALAISLAPAVMAGEFAAAVAVNINQATAGPAVVASVESLMERRDGHLNATRSEGVRHAALGERLRVASPPEWLGRLLSDWWAAGR